MILGIKKGMVVKMISELNKFISRFNIFQKHTTRDYSKAHKYEKYNVGASTDFRKENVHVLFTCQHCN